MRRPADAPRRPKGPALPISTLLLCGTLLASAAPAGAAAAGAGEIVPGKSVGDVRLGMSTGELFQRWGPPERTDRDSDGVTLYDYGEKQGVGVFVDGDQVSQILVVTPDWITTNGIKVGATRPEVLAFYGQPDTQLTGQTQDEVRIWYKRRGLVFIFKGRAVAGITVVAAESSEAPTGGPADDPTVGHKPFRPTPGPTPLSR